MNSILSKEGLRRYLRILLIGICKVSRVMSVSFAIFLIFLVGYAWTIRKYPGLLPEFNSYEFGGLWERRQVLFALSSWMSATAFLWMLFAFVAFLLGGQRMREFIAFALAFVSAAFAINHHFSMID